MPVNTNFAPAIITDNYTPNVYDEFGMIGKIAYSYIREVTAKNPLAVFNKMPVDNGDTIEQAVIKLAAMQAYDPTGANTLAPDRAEKFAVRYFKDWTRGTFKTTVDMPKLRKALLSAQSAAEVAGMITSVLAQSDIHDNFKRLKELLVYGRTNGSAGEGQKAFIKLPDVRYNNGINYKGILKQIKDTVSGMKFVNSNYNAASIERSTLEEDIFIIMPYTIKNAIDVDELSGVFNLDKAEIRNKIIEIDTIDNCIYIVDRNAILEYTRLFEMLEQLNAEGNFRNYFLHTERMYAISPLFDATYFFYEVEGNE